MVSFGFVWEKTARKSIFTTAESLLNHCKEIGSLVFSSLVSVLLPKNEVAKVDLIRFVRSFVLSDIV